jgi:hypothetical protein
VDWVTGTLYWTENVGGSIKARSLSGHVVTVYENLPEPRGLAVDPAAG